MQLGKEKGFDVVERTFKLDAERSIVEVAMQRPAQEGEVLLPQRCIAQAERRADRIARAIMHKIRMAKPHFHFRRMHIHIHFFGMDLQEQSRHRVASHHQQGMISLQKRSAQ